MLFSCISCVEVWNKIFSELLLDLFKLSTLHRSLHQTFPNNQMHSQVRAKQLSKVNNSSNLCDVRTTDCPFLLIFLMMFHSFLLPAGSTPVVGSSMKRIGGFPTKAMATFNFLLLPPEYVPHCRSAYLTMSENQNKHFTSIKGVWYKAEIPKVSFILLLN